MPGLRWELFHAIADAGSAEARRRVTALGLERRIIFRNVAFETHSQTLKDRGGGEVPALWDGSTLRSGVAPVLAGLELLVREDPGPPTG
jgi:hypothetical protein